MINLITEKQKVQAIVPDAKVSQELDDSGIYYTIVQTQQLSTRQQLQLSLLFSPRRTAGKIVSETTFKIHTPYN